jgi:hypothetical protein
VFTCANGSHGSSARVSLAHTRTPERLECELPWGGGGALREHTPGVLRARWLWSHGESCVPTMPRDKPRHGHAHPPATRFTRKLDSLHVLHVSALVQRGGRGARSRARSGCWSAGRRNTQPPGTSHHGPRQQDHRARRRELRTVRRADVPSRGPPTGTTRAEGPTWNAAQTPGYMEVTTNRRASPAPRESCRPGMAGASSNTPACTPLPWGSTSPSPSPCASATVARAGKSGSVRAAQKGAGGRAGAGGGEDGGGG